MKLKFWEKDHHGDDAMYYEQRTKRPRETLTQTAEKLIQRKMKKDPDGYGLEAAEKLKGMSKPEPKTVREFLSELREYRSAMKDAGLEGEGGSILQTVIKTVAEAMAPVIQHRLMEQQQRPQAAQQQQALGPAVPRLQPLQPKAERQATEAKLEALLPLLELQSGEFVEALSDSAGDGDEQSRLWLFLLANTSYEGLVSGLSPLRANPDYCSYIDELTSPDRREWLENVITSAKGAWEQLQQVKK